MSSMFSVTSQCAPCNCRLPSSNLISSRKEGVQDVNVQSAEVVAEVDQERVAFGTSAPIGPRHLLQHLLGVGQRLSAVEKRLRQLEERAESQE